MTPVAPSPRSAQACLRWLERYARHHGLEVERSSSLEKTLKPRFSAAAWRVVCRSPRSAFQPIVRNPLLGFADLVRYAQGLASCGFRVAPMGKVLSAFLRSNHPFFDQSPLVPVARDELAVIRLADREGHIGPGQLYRIRQWLRAGHKIAPRMSLAAVLLRASAWHTRQRAQASAVPWAFACSSRPWCGFEIVPLTTAVDLWDDGRAMSTCLYSLRGECDSDAASRFFSIRKAGRRYATLELSWTTQPAGEHLSGSYRLRDCRLSANRRPPAELIEAMTRFAAHYQQLAEIQGLCPQPRINAPWSAVDWSAIPRKPLGRGLIQRPD